MEKRLTDDRARQILARAAEMDRAAADSVSVETLRSAAHEADISEASFEAALREQEESVAVVADQPVNRRKFLIGAAVATAVATALFLSRAVVVEAPAEPVVRDQVDTPRTKNLKQGAVRRR